jgi:hypothetical protein
MGVAANIPTTQKALRYYFLSGIVESIIALALLFLIPADPKNSWLFGFSKTRLGMLGVLIGVALVFLFLSARYWQNTSLSDKINSLFEEYSWFFPIALAITALIFLGIVLNLNQFARDQNLTTVQGILFRLFPFFFLLSTRVIQTILASTYISLQKEKRPEQAPENNQVIVIKPKKITTMLFTIVVILMIAGTIIEIIQGASWGLRVPKIGSEFNLQLECNTPTLISSYHLLYAAFTLAIIALLKNKKRDPFRKHWVFLAAIFFMLAIDEGASYHEWLFDPLENLAFAQGVFEHTWVLGATPLLLLFAIVYFKFFLHLPRRTKTGILIAAALFVGGALGMEIVESLLIGALGEMQTFSIFETAEEIMELTGVVVLIYTLLNYLSDNFQEICIHFAQI